MRINRPIAISAAGALTAIALSVLAMPMAAMAMQVPAQAQSNPPWEPDTNALGTLTLYNATGQVITSGSSLTHLFDYAEASTADPFGGETAFMTFAQPQQGQPTGNFPASNPSNATVWPSSSYPAPLNTATNPVGFLSATEGNLADFIAPLTKQTAAGYANVYQIRMYTSGPGGIGSANNGEVYWDADVMIDPTAGTWTEVYPTTGTTTATTTTTLSVSPASPAQQGSPVTMTATVAASDATMQPGTVEFDQVSDGIPSSVGTVSVSTSTGEATLTTSALLPSPPSGANAAQLTATFTPSSSSYTGSTSSPLSYTVNPVANVPTISGAHQAGQRETCSDGRLDFGVTASYTWLASGKSIGTGSSITVPGSAYKKALACRVTVHDGSGPLSAAQTSHSVTVSLGKALKDSKKPSLSGRHKVGKTETVKAGSWPRGAKFTYQWLLNGKVIKHATKSSLKLSKGDKGKKISCRVTAHLAGFGNGVATTSSVKVTS